MGVVSILPFGRISLMGFWIGLMILALVVAGGVWVDQHGLIPASLLAWPPAISDPRVADLVRLIPGPGTAIAGAIAAYGLLMALIRRLHDRGFGGLLLVWKIIGMAALGWTAWNIEAYVPGMVGTVISAVTGIVFALLALRVLIICLFLRGQVGENRFGPDPAG